MKPNSQLPPSRTADQFVVRFPDGMREKIAAIAKTNGRSMNAEIIARLEESFKFVQYDNIDETIERAVKRTVEVLQLYGKVNKPGDK